ncbi:MAG: VWA domain-containing protein [Deltaproteobacteria bacterium]|nr:VWA domain-containing protein [Deltaproteobacteria bacterium]
MSKCEELREDLVAYADGELEASRKAEIEAHLEGCEGCRALLEDLRSVGERLQAWQAVEPGEGWDQRAEQRIRAAAEARKKAKPRRSFWLRPAFAWGMGTCMLLLVGAWVLLGKSFKGAQAPQALAGREAAESSNYYHHRNLKSFGTKSSTGFQSEHKANRRARPGSSDWYRPAPEEAGRPDPGDWSPDPAAVQPMPVPPVHRAPPPPPPMDGEPGRITVKSEPVYSGPVANPNAWYESTYQPGAGGRERVDKLIAEGVLVDGKKLKLGSFTRSYRQGFIVPGKRALALSAELDRAQVLASSGGEVFLQIGIQAAAREMRRRPPLNIALVIDRSGSMSDEGKMASARQAAQRFLRALRPDDVACVVAYDDEVKMRCSAERERGGADLAAFVSSLQPGGSTNIHGALDAAYRQVGRSSRPELVNTVILLSDGLPTAGNTSTGAIVELARVAAEHGISTTTVGVGLDYNDELMMGAARRGQGHYHFVKDASSIEPIFEAEFESLNRVVARALRLRIVLADGVVLKRVLGSKALSGAETAQVRREERHIDQRLYEELGIRPDRDEAPDEGIKMLIPYFFSSDSHVVMLQLVVPPGHAGGRRKLASVTLKYKDLLFARNGADERDAAVRYTASSDEVVGSISRAVKKNLLGFRAGEALLAAADLIAAGRSAQAAGMIDAQRELFDQAGRAWGDAELAKDASLLERYRDVILSLADPRLAGRESLRAYLSKTMSHTGYRLIR